MKKKKQMAFVPRQNLENLRELVSLQCSNGNWNYDEYMFGLANGLMLGLSTIEASDYKPLSAPEKWLRDRKDKVVPEVCA